MKIVLHPRFQKSVKQLRAADRDRVRDALLTLQDGFGSRHLHSGLGIRRLHKDMFECCAGLHWRMVFLAEKNLITVYDVMTHDQIRTWLRSF